MSRDASPETPPVLEEMGEKGLSSARFLDSRSTTLAPTKACPNCGRRFTGNYCPTCGQKADAELTVWDIIGGFFRDLFDTNQGLWPTFKGLTLTPGRTLRHYLSGARRQYTNPGRYLLVAALFAGLVPQLERWFGVSDAAEPIKDTGAIHSALSSIQAFVVQTPEYSWIAFSCLFAGLLSLLYRQLFASKARSTASAVAIAVFVTAHGLILVTTIKVCWRFPQFVTTGTSAAAPIVLTAGTMLGYAGISTYRCFESHWTDGLKAILAVGWATVECFSTVGLVIFGYGVVLYFIDPASYQLDGPVLAAAVGALLFVSIPFFLHAGVAAYARSR